MRALLGEDHQELAETVADVLRGEGIAADVARDGQAALDRSTVNGYDVIVLDRDLPGVHGDKVCRALAAGGSQSRVLMLTAAGGIEDRFDGLEALLGDTSEGLKARHSLRAPQLHRFCCTARSGSGAVHGEDVPGVSTEMARDVEWAVSDALNQYLTLSRQHRLSRRGRLLRLLDQHPDRPQGVVGSGDLRLSSHAGTTGCGRRTFSEECGFFSFGSARPVVPGWRVSTEWQRSAAPPS